MSANKATDGENDQTQQMFIDIQQKLSELNTIEKFQREITLMKDSQLKTLNKLNEAKRAEKQANDHNATLYDRISQLESDLESQKLLNKDLKREKQHFEQQNLTQQAKLEQLNEVL